MSMPGGATGPGPGVIPDRDPNGAGSDAQERDPEIGPARRPTRSATTGRASRRPVAARSGIARHERGVDGGVSPSACSTNDATAAGVAVDGTGTATTSSPSSNVASWLGRRSTPA